MGTKLNRRAYRQLIQEDLDWLESMPRSLERDHIIQIVKASEFYEYGDDREETIGYEEFDFSKIN